MTPKFEEVLRSMNRSELVQIARADGAGNVPRDASTRDLVDVVLTGEGAEPDALDERRDLMEKHITRNRGRLLSQLPGCTGKCVTYGCPDLIVMRCWKAFSRDML